MQQKYYNSFPEGQKTFWEEKKMLLSPFPNMFSKASTLRFINSVVGNQNKSSECRNQRSPAIPFGNDFLKEHSKYKKGHKVCAKNGFMFYSITLDSSQLIQVTSK